MKKPILILTLLASLLALPAPAGAQQSSGFLMVGTDAAYADFTHGEDCNVFVGYVWADMVVYFSPFQIVRPHSDLAVTLTGDCGDFEGVVGTVDDTRAGIVTLESAYVDTIDVPLGGGLIAEVDLTWTATGPVRTEWVRQPGMRAFHRTRDAVVAGTVTITSGGTDVFTVTGADEVGEARITRYNEIQW